MRSLRNLLICSVAACIATLSPSVGATGSRTHPHHSHAPYLLVGGLGSGSGSTIGPDGDLYVAEPASGTIVRVDPRTGETSTFARGLPTRLAGLPAGGVMDIGFIGHTAYALVTLVGTDVGGTSGVGLYRIDGRDAFTMVTDIGAWSIAHPPSTAYFVPSGVQYALQRWHRGFLVTDGHHNRVLRVTTHGGVHEVIAFGDVVPTGIDIARRRVFLAEAGPVPHLPADGRVVAFTLGATTAHYIASGASILTDVEVSNAHQSHGRQHGEHRHGPVYAISNGIYSGAPEGSPGVPDTGSLVKANEDGGFDVVAADLDRPTSLELAHGNAYVVTYNGEVWVVPLHHGSCR
jgi:hypothetical protein